MFSFSAGVLASSSAISSQHLLAQARAHKAVENLEEAKKSYRGAVEKAQAEHEKNPGDRKVKEAFDAIRTEFFTFLSKLPESSTAANLGEPSHTSPSFPQQNPSLPINRNDTATPRPRSAPRAQEVEAGIAALSPSIRPSFPERRPSPRELISAQTGTSTSMPAQQLPVISPAQEKSALVDCLFEKALSTLASLKIPHKPSLFLMYAHNNPAYGVAKAEIATYFIDKLSTIHASLYSDQTPMGPTYSSPPDARKADGKLEDILTSQLCLLPGQLRNDVKPVDKVVVCCSELLGKYLAWPHYENFRQDLQKAYHQDLKQQSTSAIREVVRKYSQEKPYQARFHHVLTEIAFLQIRAQERKDQCGIIPVLLTPKSYEGCLADFIPATAVRMEDMLRFEAQAQAGQEVYPNQGRHWVLFKLIERLLAGNDEAKTFLDKFWQGYSKLILRLKDAPSTLDALEFDELVEDIFKDIRTALHSQLAITVQQQHQQLKHQQEIALQSKQEPLAILGQNIEAEYFTAWEEPGEIQDGLTMYVAPQATTVTNSNTTFYLDKVVTAFLKQKENAAQKTQVLLLRGEAGSGKSTFNRQLARRLWREYSAAPASDGRPIPLYIALPTIDKPNKNLIGQYLSDKCGFSPEQIDALRESQHFILILDGYDEIPAEQRNLYADEKLDQWQAKIILSCRPEYLTEGYKNYLQPRGCSRLLLEYQIAPFSELLIDTYIDQYVKHTQAKWSAQQYKDTLARMPNINALLGTPFLLKMALSVLPTLDEVQSDHVGLTRIQLYEQFVQTWFERALARLKAIQSKLTDAQQKAFRSLEDEFIEHSQVFNTDFALAMSEAKTTVAEYSAIARRGMPRDTRYEPFLSNKDEEKNLLLFSALLIRQHQQYRFIHKSIQDYLVARAVWEELENASGLDASYGAEPLNEIKHVRVLWDALPPTIPVNPAALFNQFNLVEELAIQRFLVERVQQHRALVKLLLAWIKSSTSQDSVSTAAANAITILVRVGVPFTRANLKNIQIPGADLSFGVFDSAQLQGADLSNANLRNSWLREANLSGAQMAGVQFGEWPYLQEESSVCSCAYSSDGKTCAIGLENNTISVYATSTWEKIHTLQGHTGRVNSVVYSPSGDQIASGSGDRTVRLWDAQTGAPGHTLQGHTDGVNSVVYSPSGEQIASGSVDKTVRLWNVQTGEPGLILRGHTNAVWSVAYSRSGRQIASGSADKTVRLWDLQTGESGLTLQGHIFSVSSVVYSPSGEQIASGSEDTTVRLWDVQTGEPEHMLQGHTSAVYNAVYSPSGQQIASGSVDRTVRLWDVQTGEPERMLQGHTSSVLSVVYSPSGQQIVSGSVDGTVRLWDVQTVEPERMLQGHTDGVNSVVYSPSGQQIASASRDKTVRLWDVQTGEPDLTLQGHIFSVMSVVYSPSGQQIASGSVDKTVRLWDAQTGAPGHTLQGHTDGVSSVVYSPNGKQIASGSADKTVRLWDVQTGAPGHTLQGHADGVYSVVYSPSGEQIASGSFDNTVRLWDVQTGAPGHTLQGHTSAVLSVVYSPSGKQIASGSFDNTVRLWDVQTGAPGHTLQGHTSAVSSVVYSPSGEQLASGSGWDMTVLLWETQTGQCKMMIQDCGTISSLAWKEISDSHYLGIGSEDKSVRQWEIKKEGEEYKAVFCWSSTHSFLTVRGTSIEGVHGLDRINQALLKQRGAVGEPSSSSCEASQRIINDSSFRQVPNPGSLDNLAAIESIPPAGQSTQSVPSKNDRIRVSDLV